MGGGKEWGSSLVHMVEFGNLFIHIHETCHT